MFKKYFLFLIISIFSIILVLFKKEKYEKINIKHSKNSECYLNNEFCNEDDIDFKNIHEYDIVNYSNVYNSKYKNKFSRIFHPLSSETTNETKIEQTISLFLEFFENTKFFLIISFRSGLDILHSYGIVLISLIKLLFLWFIIIEPHITWIFFKLKKFFLNLDYKTKKYIVYIVSVFSVFSYLAYYGVIKYFLNKISNFYKLFLKKLFKINEFLFNIFPYIISFLLYAILIKAVSISLISLFIYSFFFPFPSIYSIIIIIKYVYLPNINDCVISSLSENNYLTNNINNVYSNINSNNNEKKSFQGEKTDNKLEENKKTIEIPQETKRNNKKLEIKSIQKEQEDENGNKKEVTEKGEEDENEKKKNEKKKEEIKKKNKKKNNVNVEKRNESENGKEKEENLIKNNLENKNSFIHNIENINFNSKNKIMPQHNNEALIKHESFKNKKIDYKIAKLFEKNTESNIFYYDVPFLLEYWLFINILKFLNLLPFLNTYGKIHFLYEYFILLVIIINISEKLHEFLFKKNYKSSILVRILKKFLVNIVDFALYFLFNIRIKNEDKEGMKQNDDSDFEYIQRSNLLISLSKIIKKKIKLNKTVKLTFSFLKSVITENIIESVKLPSYVRFFINLLIYMPQLILLIFPTFVLKLYFAYFFYIFPIFGSLKCLEKKNSFHNKIYFICYFFFYNIASVTVNNKFFKCLPFYNLYKILITISIQTILKYIFNILKIKN
ncbi:conserved Plasmodium protein, unknown function [Plasmodium relictum]|uniref:Uncharacterized protein n=1 Tax=Plasmodium relictum TaxID=85471 RepID=A0A1J1HAT5_PLARL|nr:conserved Plasmodium protein, unknown function [Plasmodium relictum]CRH02593.1 conserved Plasmodium protein, unknown function [Plasmodium relictum]